MTTRHAILFSGLAAGLLAASIAYALPTSAGSPPWLLCSLDGKKLPTTHTTRPSDAGFSSAAAWSLSALPQPLAGSGTFSCPLSLRVRSWVHVIATMLHCDDATAKFELRYLNLLGQVSYYETSGRRLYLYDDAHQQPRLAFELQPSHAPLAASVAPAPPSL
ncbi:META domain-containing protein [Hymenobacter sp. J193]|uniref:META domain-containing protein n=1 Tax=Hymenobacter sp. J193 TaxID=2898429 RepID=UPI0021511F11|nr:META domain-containing protein [Hymenobacter sp. J193]MCR5888270.1 META domain-containing protein [Hymenobacter sp. J193]